MVRGSYCRTCRFHSAVLIDIPSSDSAFAFDAAVKSRKLRMSSPSFTA
jgi:hypothetical protein